MLTLTHWASLLANFFYVDKLGIGLESSGVYSPVSITNVMVNVVYRLFPLLPTVSVFSLNLRSDSN